MTLSFEAIQQWTEAEAKERLSASEQDVAAVIKVAAEAGVVEAQALCGQIYLDGRGTERDEVQALHWFSRAAQANHVMAMNMVGRCCEHGWGTPKDPSRAAQWYRAAADRGLDWAMYNLATLHCLGEGVPTDRALALRLFRSAAGKGHVKSLSMIGGFYEDGWVVAPDMEAAAEYYRRAAVGGDFRGAFNHARMRLNAGDVAEASRWLLTLPQSATSLFLDKVVAWLRSQHIPQLGTVIEELERATGH